MTSKASILRAVLAAVVLVGGICAASASAWTINIVYNGTYASQPLKLALRAGGLVPLGFTGSGSPIMYFAVPGLYIPAVAVVGYDGQTHWCDAGRWPIALAAADLDGDTDTDLAVVLRDEGGVAVLTCDGAGGFARTAFYDTGIGSQAVVATDVNKDTKIDLVVANRFDGTVIRLINTGSGFVVEPPVELPAVQPAGEPEVCSEPNAMTVVDVNGDTWPDVAVACAGDDSVKILTNRFGLLTLTGTYPAGPCPVAVAAGDLNRDGLVDLAVADRESPQVTVLLQNITGLFTPWDVFLVGVPYGAFNPPADLALVYLDNNRTLDIRCSGYLLHNDGTGCAGTVGISTTPETVYYPIRETDQTTLWVYDGAGHVTTTVFADPLPWAPADINGDNYVNIGDLQSLVAAWGTASDTSGRAWNPYADCNSDGYVNVGDLQMLVFTWGLHQ